jgi:SAM-dependent methyltransferase
VVRELEGVSLVVFGRVAAKVQARRILTPACLLATVPDAAALVAARRYAALQPFIVDKEPLFDAMIELVETRGTRPSRIIELGVGTGGFLGRVARTGVWPVASLVGADLSGARIEVAGETMASLGRPATLCAGVNALDAADPFFENTVPPGTADMVVLAQFEHYAPNDQGSSLAWRLTQAGSAWCTKSELRRLAWSRLRPGGWLFVIDDYAAGTAELQACWDRAWDAHVVREFAGEAVRRALKPVGRFRTEFPARGYHPKRPLEERLALAARARSRRRHRDGEEVQALSVAYADFRELFGGASCGLVPHPATESHPQFYLLWGRRSSG